MKLGLLLALFVASCVESSLVPCGEITCPSSQVCAHNERCVLQSQLDACVDANDGLACSYPGVTEGVCAEEVCLPAGCGNEIVETAAGEVCDDGNRLSFDGCSADCKSDEICGDGIVDGALNEDCDCGDGSAAVDDCTMANTQAPGATCRTDCTVAGCGDGVVDPGELCDDGNNVPGDGCRADCLGRWTPMVSNTFATLTAVWGSSPTDVWAGGETRMLHYDGTAWTSVLFGFDLDFKAIWGSSDNNVWAVTTNRIYRFDGTAWSIATTGTSDTYLAGVHGTSANDVWFVGARGSDGVVIHWNGAQFTYTYFPNVRARSVWTSSTDAYLTMGDTLYRFDDLWQAVTPLLSVDVVWGTSVTNVFAAGYNVYRKTTGDFVFVAGTDDLFEVLALGGSENDVLALGPEARMMRLTDAGWVIVPTPTLRELYAIWGYAPGKAFVVGDEGTILY